MLKWILFILISFNLFALEISLQGAKENFQNYSTLHVKDINPFLCQEIKNDFNIVTKIVCAFPKQSLKKIKKVQNNFFEINSVIKKKTFFIVITPFKKMKLYPIIFDLVNEESVYQADVKLSKHWMIIGYRDEIPYVQNDKSSDMGINFPYMSKVDKLPFVEGLDIKGNPIHIKKIGDVSNYLKIKKYYKDGKYDLCLDLIDEVLEAYPDSLFGAELLYYKIRTFTELKDFDNEIEVAKAYLKEHSSDENVPEVLALTAQAYAKIGMDTDADYFFDRLFSEHADSPYAEWGYIYKAEMLESSGGDSKALIYYNKALNETDDINIAISAAYKLTLFYINKANKKEASKYAMKIVKVKPSYFNLDFATSMEMMYAFEESEDFKTAAAIAKAILDEIDVDNDDYERLLKDRGVWLSKTSQKQEALQALNEYIEKFNEGLFEEDVKVAKDSLFFDEADENLTTKLSNYSELIQTYKEDSIGDKAIYEKAKLLLENGMYSDVLDFKESILGLDSQKYPDTKEIITQAAVGTMEQALKHKECHGVLNISNDYNITLSDKWDDGIYACSMKGADFILAKKIAGKNLKSKDLNQRKKWLYRYIKIDFATGNYSDVVEASKELISLTENDKESKYRDVYRILFDTYQRLENSDKMLETIVKLEKIYKFSYKDIERYVAVMTIGSDIKDDNIVIRYGNAVMKIQNSSNSYAQSPFVEFTLYQSYINKKNYIKALESIKFLDKVDLSKTQRARQKYLLGSVCSKLWRDEAAQKAYQESIDADPDSAWAKLAKDAKNI